MAPVPDIDIAVVIDIQRIDRAVHVRVDRARRVGADLEVVEEAVAIGVAIVGVGIGVVDLVAILQAIAIGVWTVRIGVGVVDLLAVLPLTGQRIVIYTFSCAEYCNATKFEL